MLWCHDFTVCDHLMNILSLHFFSLFSFSVYSVNEITATFRRENTQSSARRTVPRNLQGLICFWFCSQINVTLLYWLAWERGHRLMLGTLHFFLYALLYSNYMFVFDASPLEVFCSFAQILRIVKRFKNGTFMQNLQAIPLKVFE